MYIWQNKLFLPNYLHITECFFLDSFFFCHKSKEKRKTPEGKKCHSGCLQGEKVINIKK